MVPITAERLNEIFQRARALRIAVIGDLMLDVYLTGTVARISPEAPVPVVQVTEERVALGGAANVAANVAALGAECTVVGYVGEDAAAAQLRAALSGGETRAIQAHLLSRSNRPTTTKTRVMARRQQVVRFDRERDDDLPADCMEELCDLVQRVVREADVVVLEDYNKGVLTPPVIRAALEVARELGVPSVVDPKFRHFFAYRGATVFKPNLGELSAALGVPAANLNDGEIEEARKRIGCAHLLVTLGEQGMLLSSEGEAPRRVPALAREVYDVSGAGDTVTACVAVALGAGASMPEATMIANFAAAIEVGKPGVATVTPDEIAALLAAARAADSADLPV